MSRTVFLHIGAPKTGTTYVQDRLALNATSLRRHGYRYPTGPRADMFLAALDLIEQPWPGMEGRTDGQWEALVRRVRRSRGTVVISHEILAAAPEAAVARALDDLSFADVHVVYSARDVARQVPAEWQEQLKHQRRVAFATFVRRVQDDGPQKSSRWFWRVHGLPLVLERWTPGLAPDHVHVLTVPQASAPPGELWRRFCETVGIDVAWASRDSARRNPSIGAVESVLLRRLNRRLQAAGLPPDQYGALVRQVVVQETLAGRPGRLPVTLPPDAFGWADRVAQHWIDWIERTGVRVVGDLDDLRPVHPAPDAVWHDPDRPRPRALTSAALDALVAVILEAARRPDPDASIGSRAGRLARHLRR